MSLFQGGGGLCGGDDGHERGGIRDDIHAPILTTLMLPSASLTWTGAKRLGVPKKGKILTCHHRNHGDDC